MERRIGGINTYHMIMRTTRFPHLSLRLYAIWVAASTGMSFAATDLWELPPMRYSDREATDPLAVLAAASAPGMVSTAAQTPLERLRYVLKLLDVPEESQVLVFSKTSKQNSLIHPGNPRCLYFNENSYVGYVPGGDIEVITHDPVLGVVFYLIRSGGEPQTMRISRDNSQCLTCHGTARTESVPGVLVRSVFPDESGMPIFSHGSFLIHHGSPLHERWGGYYVTGHSSLPHLGNRTFTESTDRPVPAQAIHLKSLEGKIDTSRYLRDTSDIVALLVLEHQCHVHNTLAAAAVNYRRAYWLQKSLDPSSDPDAGSAGRQADDAAKRIVELLLFENEASLGDEGVTGDTAYQDAFARRFPKSRDGRSLADFNLYGRLFKHHCSYMVYSSTFRSLPERVRSAVIRELHAVVTNETSPQNHPELKMPARRRLAAILGDTLAGWPG
jgi:hypothetical protein